MKKTLCLMLCLSLFFTIIPITNTLGVSTDELDIFKNIEMKAWKSPGIAIFSVNIPEEYVANTLIDISIKKGSFLWTQNTYTIKAKQSVKVLPMLPGFQTIIVKAIAYDGAETLSGAQCTFKGGFTCIGLLFIQVI